MSPRFKPVAILPTLCTLGNTFCGFLAISKVGDALLEPARFGEHVLFAAWMLLLAMVFDALDGRIARMTNQASDFGAQLDSLTDLITFGVAPAFLVKAVFDHAMTEAGVAYQQKITLMISAIYVICATLRLARFTLETDTSDESHEKFYGLPSPAAAGVIAATTFLMFESGSPLAGISPDTRLLLTRIWIWSLPVLGMLMVSKVEYVHLVSRWGRGRKPFLHLIAIVLTILVVVAWHEAMFFVCFAGYAFGGPFMAIIERSTGRRVFAPADDEDGAALPGGAHALVALGSNLGDRKAHLEHALARLRELPATRVVAVSELVETAPVGGPAQRPFLNGAARLFTALSPEELLARLHEIEAERGRERSVQDGPRTLDLDLILHGATICETRTLTLPHPRFRERAFVLDPAAAVAPELVDPVTGKTLARLREEHHAGNRP